MTERPREAHDVAVPVQLLTGSVGSGTTTVAAVMNGARDVRDVALETEPVVGGRELREFPAVRTGCRPGDD